MTFFSTTDQEELHDNATNHNYYLSLIVNFKRDYKAKIAYVAEHNTEIIYSNAQDKKKKFHDTKQILVIVDLDVEISAPEVSKELVDRYDVLQEKKEAKKTSIIYTPIYPGYDARYPGSRIGNAYEDTGRSLTQGAKQYPGGNSKLTEKEGKDILFQWLKKGLEIDPFLAISKGSFSSIAEGINFLEGKYHNKEGHLNNLSYEYFLDQMQKDLYHLTFDHRPSVVSHRLKDTLAGYRKTHKVAADLYTLADAHVVYSAQMKKHTQIYWD